MSIHAKTTSLFSLTKPDMTLNHAVFSCKWLLTWWDSGPRKKEKSHSKGYERQTTAKSLDFKRGQQPLPSQLRFGEIKQIKQKVLKIHLSLSCCATYDKKGRLQKGLLMRESTYFYNFTRVHRWSGKEVNASLSLKRNPEAAVGASE